MACELLSCCQFFNNKMKDMPKTAEYIRNNVCRGEYESCTRYRIYKEFGGDHIPFSLHSDDNEEVKKVIQCLQNKRMSEE